MRKRGRGKGITEPNNKSEGSSSSFSSSSSSSSWVDWLFDSVDAKPLAIFRILWGLVLLWEMYTLIRDNFEKTDVFFFSLPHNLPYYGFEWLPRLSLPQAHLLVYCCALSVVGIILGLFYRVSMSFFIVLFGYVYFYEGSVYLNHLYLVLVVCSTLLFIPCNSRYSLDSYLFPSTYSPTVPRWTRLLLEILMTCVYTHAAIAKMNRDWLRAEPLCHWLPKRAHIYGAFFGQESFAYLITYGGLIYDAMAAPLIICPSTRPYGIFLNIFFHSLNKIIFNIGIFPYMMIAYLVLFIDWSFLESKEERWRKTAAKRRGVRREGEGKKKNSSMMKWGVVCLLLCYTLFHVGFPLRHYLYPGDVTWNEYGHLYSWRMKLRDKNCYINDIWSYLPHKNPTNISLIPITQKYFTPRQIAKARSRPDFLSFIAHTLSEKVGEIEGTGKIPIYIDVECQLNYGPISPLTDPNFDIASHPTFQWPYPWVLPSPPFPDSLYDDFPWNFEWSFSWITTFPVCNPSGSDPFMGKR